MKKISFITNFFWKTVKPPLSGRIMTSDRINLSEKEESVKTELESAEVLNRFFSNIVNHLEISKYSKYESFIDNIEDQTLRAILKYKNHPSIIAIQNKFEDGDVFYFRELEREEILKEIHKLSNNKASQHSDIPTKIIKSNSDIFSDFLYVSIKSLIKLSRSSHRRCSVRKGVLRNFAKFTGKHLCQRFFFNKVAGLRPATLLKKSL